jgi:hypothetical protein
VARQQPKPVRADVNGHYVFKNVPRGKYYLFARHEVFDNRLRWFLPLNLDESAKRVDLSLSNVGWPFDPPLLPD